MFLNRKKRDYEERFFKAIMQGFSFLVVTIMTWIIISVFIKGFPAINLEMITSKPSGGFYFGGGGGILNAIIGSLYLAIGSTFIALFISLPVSMYLNVNMIKHIRLKNFIRLFIDVLWGVPSVVYGAFAFSVMIYLGMRSSLLAGIITVSIFIVPIMIRSMDEVLKQVPRELYESALSLGSTNHEIAYKVFFRQCLPGLVTAVLLSFGRAIGDAAAPLFTTGFTDNLPSSLTQPAATLPLAIFFQLSSPNADVQTRAYASAVVLTVIILIISISGRLIFYWFSKNRIK